jgi:hypothetical protein
MERYCSTGQSPQRAVVSMEEEEENVRIFPSVLIMYLKGADNFLHRKH